MTQFFKGDDQEKQFYQGAFPVFDGISSDKDAFFVDAFNCFKLGEVLYDSGAVPMSKAIPRDVFRQSFAALFDSFVVAGSFESYLAFFKEVFGDDVIVEFTVPAPGKLQIDVLATGVVLNDFTTDDGDTVTDQDGDNIEFQTVEGFNSEYELKQMLFEMVPDGIVMTPTLSVSGGGTFFMFETGDLMETESGDFFIGE